MIPIEKNITVVDENGNFYEATYPKRAKGLVKNGRARFIAENTICLACPPDTETEDKTMSENMNIKATEQANESQAELIPDLSEKKSSDKLTIDYILSKLNEIAAGQAFLTDAISELGKLKANGPGDVGTQEQARAIGEIIKAREATNQKLIALYEKMYDDLKPKEESAKNKALEMLSKIVTEVGFYETEQGAEILSDMLDTIRHLG